MTPDDSRYQPPQRKNAREEHAIQVAGHAGKIEANTDEMHENAYNRRKPVGEDERSAGLSMYVYVERFPTQEHTREKGRRQQRQQIRGHTTAGKRKR